MEGIIWSHYTSNDSWSYSLCSIHFYIKRIYSRPFLKILPFWFIIKSYKILCFHFIWLTEKSLWSHRKKAGIRPNFSVKQQKILPIKTLKVKMFFTFLMLCGNMICVVNMLVIEQSSNVGFGVSLSFGEKISKTKSLSFFDIISTGLRRHAFSKRFLTQNIWKVVFISNITSQNAMNLFQSYSYEEK